MPNFDGMGYRDVPYKGLPVGSTTYFAQMMKYPGSLRDPVLPNYGLNNSQSLSSGLGNFTPPFPTIDINAPIATNFNIDLTLGGGGGGGTAYSSVSSSVTWLTLTTTTNPAGGTDYGLTLVGADFCSAVNSCVSGGGGGALDGFGVLGTNTVNVADATVPNDTATLAGDWALPDDGTKYIKTDAVGKTVNITFERYLHEYVDTDDSSVIGAGRKGAITKFTGGNGIVTSAASYDGGGGGDYDTEVTIALTGGQTEVLLITGFAAGGTLPKVGGGTDLTYKSYNVTKVLFVEDAGVIKYNLDISGTLYDFSPNVKNEPTVTGSSPVFTVQTLEDNTLVTAVRFQLPSPWPSNTWVMGGLPPLSVTCV